MPKNNVIQFPGKRAQSQAQAVGLSPDDARNIFHLAHIDMPAPELPGEAYLVLQPGKPPRLDPESIEPRNASCALARWLMAFLAGDPKIPGAAEFVRAGRAAGRGLPPFELIAKRLPPEQCVYTIVCKHTDRLEATWGLLYPDGGNTLALAAGIATYLSGRGVTGPA